MSDVRVIHADCREAIRGIPDCSVASVVTDPPYSLVSIQKRFGKPGSAPAQHGRDGLYRRAAAGFMGQQWDTGETAFDPAFWAEVLRVLKPGGHLVAFGGSRTWHRLAVAVEDAGFEIRDTICWLFGSGFPKSHDVAKAIDKSKGERGQFGAAKTEAHRRYIEKGELRGGRGNDGWQRPWMDDPEAVANAGRKYMPATEAAREWDGWGTALKPAAEYIILARKPLDGTVAENFLQHGCGALNIDACRVAAFDAEAGRERHGGGEKWEGTRFEDGSTPMPAGRWPANVIHDGSEEVLAAFPDAGGGFGKRGSSARRRDGYCASDTQKDAKPFSRRNLTGEIIGFGDAGSASRFFYSAKADATDRLGSKHPTVKPVDLMAYLVRLITPPGGTVLDPFAGSGTTGMACLREGFDCILIEREAQYVADINARLQHVRGSDTPLFAEPSQPSLLGDAA